MIRLRTTLKLVILAALGASLSGCIVLPFGGGHGRHGHGDYRAVGNGAPSGGSHGGNYGGNYGGEPRGR